MATKKLKLIFTISLLFLLSCCQNGTRSPFIDNLIFGDTLTLTAGQSCCGEFGEDIEKILITKNDHDLQAFYYEDNTISCCTDLFKKKRINEKSKILSKEDRKNIVKYINKFLIITKTIKKPCVNAIHFEIINKDTTIDYFSCKEDWWDFAILKIEVFGK